MGEERREEQDGGRQDSRFLDLEVTKVVYSAACGAARTAMRDLLVERVKSRLDARMGERLDALADLAVDDLLADLEANLAIERRIDERSRLEEEQLERLRAIFAGSESGAE